MNYIDLPDGELITHIEIPGRPATKKTHSQIIHVGNRHVLLPSKQFKAYQESSAAFCPPLGIDCGVGVELKITLDNWRVGDNCGYLQAIGDILQHYNTITNDKWISWLSSGTWLAVDKAAPRAEITIYRLRHPSESRK